MSRSIAALLILTTLLGACSTRLNPFNWFGGDREPRRERTTSENDNPLLPPERDRGGFLGLRAARERAAEYRGQPVDVISQVVLEPVPGGVLMRVIGTSRYQNVFDVRLIPAVEDDSPVEGVLSYSLQAVIPATPISGGSERLRQVTAGRILTDQKLEDVRQIRVAGIENARVLTPRR